MEWSLRAYGEWLKEEALFELFERIRRTRRCCLYGRSISLEIGFKVSKAHAKSRVYLYLSVSLYSLCLYLSLSLSLYAYKLGCSF